MTAAAVHLHELPISCRPPKTWHQILNTFLAISVYLVACCMINSFQFLFLLPLRIIPFAWAAALYDEGIRYTKGSFGLLCVLMSQWFAPTRLSVTFEREGQGRFTEEQIRQVVQRDAKGKIIALRLPSKSVYIANHQVYVDWWYMWCLSYFTGAHKDVFIVLKKSLKWVPILGWGMQFYNFIFLARSWASDRIHLASRLSDMGQHAEQNDNPLMFTLYPEGTLVSKDTRPLSKKYAEKLGVSDLENVLLPRSTGLHHSLRSLAPRVPSLHLIDITIIYPGIPPKGYGQSYYTLRSIFFDRVPPPMIRMHLRIFHIAKDVPVGDISSTHLPSSSQVNGNGKHMVIDVPEGEKKAFEAWLMKLWAEKDKFITQFHQSGSLPNNPKAFDIPVELRHKREIPDAFCFLGPALAYLLCTRIMHW